MPRRRLGAVTDGAFNAGLTARLDPDISTEDMRIGDFVIVEGEKNLYFSMISDMQLRTTDARLAADPPTGAYIGERYHALLARDDASRGALRQLLRQGVAEIVTDRARGLIRGRLQRVAPLLHDVYEDEQVWQWAIVAADALGDDSPLPFEEHPLLLGMVAYSLENATGERCEWFDALEGDRIAS